jgi:hypothetical protein
LNAENLLDVWQTLMTRCSYLNEPRPAVTQAMSALSRDGVVVNGAVRLQFDRARSAMTSRLELRVPPLIMVVITALAMWFTDVALPWLSVSLHYPAPLAGVIFIAGLGIALSGVLTFRSARTTVSPLDPASAQSLVNELIPKAARTMGDYRVYTAADVHMLRFVRRAPTLGFSMEEIGRLISRLPRLE